MSEPSQKCENNDIFKQNNALELFISLKMAISCCFGLRGNIDFPDFLQIKFYNINYWSSQSPNNYWKCVSKLAQQKVICSLIFALIMIEYCQSAFPVQELVPSGRAIWTLSILLQCIAEIRTYMSIAINYTVGQLFQWIACRSNQKDAILRYVV